ncbi:MAG: folate family ECF transporter S component [Ruminococcaceae bacterium]|nr:folate family ECF transporter S component [Oscillospiraceae bacterium]
MAVFNSFKRSLSELRSIRCLTIVGVFIAIFVVLDGYFSIRIGDSLKINFAYLALAAIGMLFGPAVGMISGFACDLVGYFANPVGAFIPWFALITALEGLIYGLFLYDFMPNKFDRSKNAIQYFLQYGRIFAARIIVVVICNLLLNTFALYKCGFIGNTEEGFWAIVWARIGTNAAGLAIALVIMPAVLIPVRLAYSRFSAVNRAR